MSASKVLPGEYRDKSPQVDAPVKLPGSFQRATEHKTANQTSAELKSLDDRRGKVQSRHGLVNTRQSAVPFCCVVLRGSLAQTSAEVSPLSWTRQVPLRHVGKACFTSADGLGMGWGGGWGFAGVAALGFLTWDPPLGWRGWGTWGGWLDVNSDQLFRE